MMPIRSLITLSAMAVVIASVSFEALARTSASNDASKLVSADTLSAASTTDATEQKDEQLLQTSETDTAQVSEERNPPTEAVSRPLKRTLDEFLNFGFSAGETLHFSSHHPGANLEAAKTYVKEWTAAQKSQMEKRVKHSLRQHKAVEKVHDELKIYPPNPELSPNFPIYRKYVSDVYIQLETELKDSLAMNTLPENLRARLQDRYSHEIMASDRSLGLLDKYQKSWERNNFGMLNTMKSWLEVKLDEAQVLQLLGLEKLSLEARLSNKQYPLYEYYCQQLERIKRRKKRFRPRKPAKKD